MKIELKSALSNGSISDAPSITRAEMSKGYNPIYLALAIITLVLSKLFRKREIK